MTPGYRALHEAAAWLDLSARGKIAASGEDRVRLLHAMTTNQVEGLAGGEGCYVFFLNAQGHILGDANLLRMPDHILLDTEPEIARKLFEHLDHYIIADDVTLEDRTGELATLSIEGPEAAAVLEALGAPAPAAPYSHAPWGDRTVARVDSTGVGGFFVILPGADRPELSRRLHAAGVPEATQDEARIVRLEHGRPRYGEDITEDHLPQETQALHAVNFSKGCYLGQEIVERVRSRGHVNRLLVRLWIDSADPPAQGTPIYSADKQAGAISSSALSPEAGLVVALGYVQAGLLSPGATFLVNGASARV